MLEISLLGEQTVADARGAVRLGSSRTLALLAFLVVHHGSPQPRQRIAGLFWPDSADEQALTNLRRELHHLRAALGGDSSLVVTPRELCWADAPTCTVDVRRFTTARDAALDSARRGRTDAFLAQADTALTVYRGEFLPGSLDDWALETRNTLEQQCVDLLDRVVDARAQGGDGAGAVSAARSRIRLRPLEEAGYRKLMQLQGALGDRAGAVSTFHHCASVLERELGVEPDPLTRDTLDRLLSRGRPAAPPGLGPAAPAGRAGPAAARLTGRATELHRLHELWQSSRRGAPRLVLLEGAAGVGKTRLMTELADAVRGSGAVVAGAQCFGAAGRLALAPVADWLRTPRIRSAVARLEPVWQLEVERLVPAAGSRAEPAALPRGMVDAWQRHRFFEGLSRALLATGGPLLLTLDNLHWCDQETLALLSFCLRVTPDAPVMVLATMREDPDGAEPGLPQWIIGIRATGMLTELHLGPLDAAGTAALAASLTGRAVSAADAELLHDVTGGFPLFVVEAARSGDAAAQPVGDLSAVLAGRLARLSEPAGAVAALAAVVGRPFDLELLSQAADLDADTVVRAVDELWRQRILREVGHGYDFSHDLLRDVAYAQISPPRRWLLHRRVAEGLEALHADDLDAVSAQLAQQYARAGHDARAVRHFQRAAEVAARTFAHDEAIRLHDEALTLVPALPEGPERTAKELALLEGLAAPLTARFGYASPRLRATLERAVALAELLGRRDSLVHNLVGLWTSQFVHGDTGAAHRTAARALALVDPASELSGAAHFAFGGSALGLGRLEESVRHLGVAQAAGNAYALSVGTRPDVHGLAWVAHAHWLLGDGDRALASCTGAIDLARTTGSPFNLAVALGTGAITHQLRGDRPALADALAELAALCDRYDFAYYREWVPVLTGWLRTDGSGVELARRGIDRLTADGALARMPYWLSLLADLLAREGRADEARATLDAAIAASRAHEDVWWLPEVLRMRAGYDGEERAVARLRDAARLAGGHGSTTLVVRCTEALRALGAEDGAFAVPPAPRAAPAETNTLGTGPS